MPLTVITPPTDEPVTLAEAKALLRIDGSEEDALLLSLIVTARLTVEDVTGHALITRTVAAVQDRWPPARELPLPVRPLQAVEAVTLPDMQGGEIVWPAANYLVEAAGSHPRLVLAPGAVWPVLHRPSGGIRIRMRAGHGDTAAEVPPPLRHAVLLLAAHWFENRLPVIVSAAATAVPSTVASLLAPYRNPRLR